MALFSETYAGGALNDPITSANTAFDAISTITGGTNVFDVGETALLSSGGTSGTVFHQITTTAGTQTTWFSRFYVWMSALPTSNMILYRVRNVTANAIAVRFNVTAGKIDIVDALFANGGLTSTNTMPTSKWVRFEVKGVHSTTAGSIECRIYGIGAGTATDTTPDETLTRTNIDTNTQGTEFSWGLLTNSTNTSMNLDAVAFDTVDWIGPEGAGGGGGGGGGSTVTSAPSGVWGAGVQNVIAVAKNSVHGAAVGGTDGLVLCGGDVSGMHRSTDGGVTWAPSNTGITSINHTKVVALAWSDTTAGVAYAYTSTQPSTNSSGYLLRTVDYGITWTQVASGFAGHTAGADVYPRLVGRMLALDEANSRIYIATQDGVKQVNTSTWAVTNLVLAGTSFSSISKDPNDATASTYWATATSVGLYKLTAVRATPASALEETYTGNTVHDCVAVNEGGSTRVYVAAGSAGVWRHTPGGASANITNGITTLASTIDAVRVGGTATRVVVSESTTGSSATAKVSWTENGHVASPTWTSSSSGNVSDLVNGLEEHWVFANLNFYELHQTGADVGQVVISPNDPTEWFLAERTVNYRWSGTTWVPMAEGLCATVGLHIQAAPNNPNNVAAGDVDWTVLRSTDGMITQPISPLNRPSASGGSAPYENGFALAFNDDGHLLVAVGDRGANADGALYRSTNPFVAAPTWTEETSTGSGAAPGPGRHLGAALGDNGSGTPVLLVAEQNSGIFRKLGVGTGGSWTKPRSSTSNSNQTFPIIWPVTAGANVYAIDPTVGLLRSTDRGVNWTVRESFTVTTRWKGRLACDPVNNTVYYTNETGLFKVTTASGAHTTTQIGSGVFTHPSAVAFKNGVLYVATACTGGVASLFKSDNAGSSFTDLTDTGWSGAALYPMWLDVGSDDVVRVANFNGGYYIRSATAYDPSTLSVVQSDANVVLTWPAPTMSGATHTAIFRKTGSDLTAFDPTVATEIARVTIGTLTYTDPNVAVGDYVYQVFPLTEV